MKAHKIGFISILLIFSLVLNAKTVKILAIGNSFSVDAVENYLHDMAKADSIDLIIGNLYIGGCSLETHWKNAKNSLPAYSYRKICESGERDTVENATLLTAILDENWDFITFQQVSQNSGIYKTYFPYLPYLMRFVKKHASNRNVRFALHQTWAYAQNSTHSGFANYGSDQKTMYEAITKTIFRVANKVGVKIVIPSGTAIQNGRATALGDNFCRDGYHLDWGMGRYTASCAWYEKLLGKSVIDNTYFPESFSREQALVARQAAHRAVAEPKKVSDLTNFP